MAKIDSGEISPHDIQYNWSTAGHRYTYLGIEAIVGITEENSEDKYSFYLDGYPFSYIPNKVLKDLWYLCAMSCGLHYPFTGAIAKLRKVYSDE